eukprot:4354935-Prymnesium_polylepis.1
MWEISAKKVVHEVGEQIERAEAIVFVKLRVKVQAIAPCAGAGSCEFRLFQNYGRCASPDS